ncbi:MAG: heavy metal translocating P-type ATPase [Pseudomonadota bacterium]|nr:heavy metal translocating P-type ATPase [Pseudomonadota bacterium]
MERQNIPHKTDLHETVNAEGYESLVHRDEDGHNSLSVLVRGVHCAGCIQKIENALNADNDISHARLNFSTGRLAFEWDGSAEAANDYVGKVMELGYDVFPYDIKEEESALKSEERFLLMCLGVAGFAAGNIMLLSVGLWTTTEETMGMATREFMHWISAVIALPAILFSGRSFFRSAFKALSAGYTNMDVPISIAVLLAGGMSLLGTLHGSEHVYFDSAIMLIFFLLIGRYLDFRARKTARSTATDLLGTLSGFANVVDGGKLRRVPVKELTEGMIVRLAAGDKCPIDGVITKGQSEIDTSLITGESVPRHAQDGDHIYAGAVNLGAALDIKVMKTAGDSLLADIIKLMEQAEQGQAQYVRVADRAAKLYTPVVHTLAALAFIGWLFVGELVWQDALMIAITVLIITCPCALGLAVPVVQVLATGRLMKRGVLVKSGDALERLATIDTVMLDKTGTLTLGKPVLQGEYKTQDMQYAASLASHSTHPLSQAVLQSYEGDILPVDKLKEHAGKGLEGVIDGKTIRLGSRAWCGDKAATDEDRAMEIWLTIYGKQTLRLTFMDILREDSASVITKFKALGIAPVIVTGDRAAVADHIAQECGIDRVYAAQTPPQKFEVLESEKAAGHNLLMLGDGLNDAPVLAGAHVSMAPGSAIDMAQKAADIIFMGDRLSPVYETYRIAVKTQKLVKQNFALAILYNCIAIPFALAGLVTPLSAALAMSGSSIVVIANSFRLKLRL